MCWPRDGILLPQQRLLLLQARQEDINWPVLRIAATEGVLCRESLLIS